MPDAPSPVYNSHGTLVQDWTIVVRFDSTRDALTVSWSAPAGQYTSAKQGAVARPPTEHEEILEDIRRTLLLLHQPRLF